MARKPNSGAGIQQRSKINKRGGTAKAGTGSNGMPMVRVGGRMRPAAHTTIHCTGFSPDLDYSLARGEFPKKFGKPFLTVLKEKRTVTASNGKNSVAVKRYMGETGFLIEIDLTVSGKREVKIYSAETGKFLYKQIGKN